MTGALVSRPRAPSTWSSRLIVPAWLVDLDVAVALWAGLNEIGPDLHARRLGFAVADRAIDVPLEADLEPGGHLRFVLAAELGQPVLPPDVGSLDADGPVGRHDAVELVDHLLGLGQLDLGLVGHLFPHRQPAILAPANAGEPRRQTRRQSRVTERLPRAGAVVERPWNPRVRAIRRHGAPA